MGDAGPIGPDAQKKFCAPPSRIARTSPKRAWHGASGSPNLEQIPFACERKRVKMLAQTKD